MINQNINYNIVGFCGKMGSGKSTIADIFVKHDYIKLSFADPLKKMICELFSIDKEFLQKNKMIEKEYILHDIDLKFMSDQTNIPLEFIIEEMSKINNTFTSIRHALQYIGTDIIRKHNPDWHVNKVYDMILPNHKYIIDDCRFKNEVEMIKKLNGTIWYIVRPKLDNLSNHESENSIKWQEINDVYINNGSIETLKEEWCEFLKNGYEKAYDNRMNILKKIQNSKLKQYLCFFFRPYFNKIKKKTLLHKDVYGYEFIEFEKYKSAEIILDKDKHYIKLYDFNDNVRIIYNSLILEDFKTFKCLLKNG